MTLGVSSAVPCFYGYKNEGSLNMTLYGRAIEKDIKILNAAGELVEQGLTRMKGHYVATIDQQEYCPMFNAAYVAVPVYRWNSASGWIDSPLNENIVAAELAMRKACECATLLECPSNFQGACDILDSNSCYKDSFHYLSCSSS